MSKAVDDLTAAVTALEDAVRVATVTAGDAAAVEALTDRVTTATASLTTAFPAPVVDPAPAPEPEIDPATGQPVATS